MYSSMFFGFVGSLQQVCQLYLSYDQLVEVNCYVCVETEIVLRDLESSTLTSDVDEGEPEILSLEILHTSGNVSSDSYCTKVSG